MYPILGISPVLPALPDVITYDWKTGLPVNVDETKAQRHVRDTDYWGMPYNTPITPGMKPKGKKPQVRVRVKPATSEPSQTNDMVTRFVKRVAAERERRTSAIKARVATWSDDDKAKAVSLVEQVRAKGQPMVAAPESAALGILDHGIQSQFATATSKAGATYRGRAVVESALFDLPMAVDPTERPIYGYLSVDDPDVVAQISPLMSAGPTQASVAPYGAIRFRLKSTAKDRTTFSFGDTMDTHVFPAKLTGPLTKANMYALFSEWVFPSKPKRTVQRDYIEAQIHGGVDVSDIAEVFVPEGDKYDRIVQAAESKGIAVTRYTPPPPPPAIVRATSAIERRAIRVIHRAFQIASDEYDPENYNRKWLESKARHVRDPDFWGKPYGTPITPGMKPKPKGPKVRVSVSRMPNIQPLSAKEYSVPRVVQELKKIKPTGLPNASGGYGDPIDCGDDIDKAHKLLAAGKHIRLNTPLEVSVLIDQIEEERLFAVEHDQDMPDYDLCNITVPGTNLFCLESKGIPRIKMPQLKGTPVEGSYAATKADERNRVDLQPEFQQMLARLGIPINNTSVKATELKATQSQLNGAVVAKIRHGFKDKTRSVHEIYVTRDGYIVDGHHHWAAVMAVDLEDGHLGDEDMPVKMIDADIGYVLDLANMYTDLAGIEKARATGLKSLRAMFGLVIGQPSYHTCEVKTRHVRDAAFWGAPVGTPLPLPEGMGKPKPRIRVSRIPAITSKPAPPPDTVELEGVGTLVKGRDSLWEHLVPVGDGKYTISPERRALLDSIAAEAVIGYPSQEHPVITMLGGGCGAGKTSVLRGSPDVLTPPDETVNIACDELTLTLRDRDPAFADIDENTMAGYLHEEASYISKQIMAACYEQKIHCILDGTGDSSLAKLQKKIDRAHEAGFEVHGVYATVPTPLAFARNVQRAINEEGRGEVPPWAVSESHQSVSHIALGASQSMDSYKLYDTTRGMTDGPRLIGETTKGKPMKVYDQATFDGFLSKDGEWGPEDLEAIRDQLPPEYLRTNDESLLPPRFFDYGWTSPAIKADQQRPKIDDDLRRVILISVMMKTPFAKAGVPDTPDNRAAWALAQRTLGSGPYEMDAEWPSEEKYGDDVMKQMLGDDYATRIGRQALGDQIKSLLDGFKAATIRRVRDPGYWGVPYNTPITPGMKPRKKPKVRVTIKNSPNQWRKITSASDVSDDMWGSESIKAVLGIGATVYMGKHGDILVLDKDLPTSLTTPKKVAALLADMDTVVAAIPPSLRGPGQAPLAVIVPANDPRLPYVPTDHGLFLHMLRNGANGIVLGYTVRDTGVINLNPTVLGNPPPMLAQRMKETGGPYTAANSARLGTLMHESGHFIETAKDSFQEEPALQIDPDTGELGLTLTAHPDEMRFFAHIVKTYKESLTDHYAMSDMYEAYAEAYAEYRLGSDTDDPGWIDMAREYADRYGWDD